MTDVLEIERAIKELPPEDYRRLRSLIENYDLERDALATTAVIADMLDDGIEVVSTCLIEREA